MLNREEREKKKIGLVNVAHVFQQFKERGKGLFAKDKVDDMLQESYRHIKNPDRSIIIPDERLDIKSTHIIMFLSDYGKMVVIPCIVDQDNIRLLTLKDLEKDYTPNWYIQKYNEIAPAKGLQKQNFITKQY